MINLFTFHGKLEVLLVGNTARNLEPEHMPIYSNNSIGFVVIRDLFNFK